MKMLRLAPSEAARAKAAATPASERAILEP